MAHITITLPARTAICCCFMLCFTANALISSQQAISPFLHISAHNHNCSLLQPLTQPAQNVINIVCCSYCRFGVTVAETWRNDGSGTSANYPFITYRENVALWCGCSIHYRMIGLVCSGHCTASRTCSRQVHSLHQGWWCGSSQMTLGRTVLVIVIQ